MGAERVGAEPDEVVWLGVAAPGAPSETAPPGPAAALTEARGPARAPRASLLVAAAVLAALWWALADAPDTPASPVEPPPTTVLRQLAPPVAELTGTIPGPLVAAVSSPLGAPGRVLWWDVGDVGPQVDSAVTLRQPRFDASGRWVAGLGLAPRSGGGAVLWAGPVGGELEPVEVGVRGFAWHDTRPGHLAWTTATPGAGGSLVTVNLVSAGPHRRGRTVDTDYRLRRWGDWGFALGSPGRRSHVTVLDPAADVVLREVPGSVAAWVPGVGVVVGAGRAGLPPRAMAADGSWWALDWVAPGEDVAEVAVSPDGTLAAVQLVPMAAPALAAASPGPAPARVVVLRDGQPVHRIGGVAGTAALGWSPDGRTLAFARQGEAGQGRIALLDVDSGTRRQVAVVPLEPGRERVEALVVQAGPGA